MNYHVFICPPRRFLMNVELAQDIAKFKSGEYSLEEFLEFVFPDYTEKMFHELKRFLEKKDSFEVCPMPTRREDTFNAYFMFNKLHISLLSQKEVSDELIKEHLDLENCLGVSIERRLRSLIPEHLIPAFDGYRNHCIAPVIEGIVNDERFASLKGNQALNYLYKEPKRLFADIHASLLFGRIFNLTKLTDFSRGLFIMLSHGYVPLWIIRNQLFFLGEEA